MRKDKQRPLRIGRRAVPLAALRRIAPGSTMGPSEPLRARGSYPCGNEAQRRHLPPRRPQPRPHNPNDDSIRAEVLQGKAAKQRAALPPDIPSLGHGRF
ncbi:hypothetical protein SKAU_G00215690 [Synaphobranchus kaupii]|uniref:Uncharacterized protein n=1 Tax=Synaphobranchus kaupii TaxID=118154 RepID=A0A9Q1IUH6_SYNKA|nr:hypothetical protein SKAU_G00215690 [Synaphobranchus kaupii]